MTPLALRVDVCTRHALHDGVPAVLALLKEARARATFMVSMGPDATGLALLNCWKPAYLRRILRNGGVGTFGWRSALYGTLLPAPLVGAGLPSRLLQIRDEGHEIALHGWDHRRWQDRLDRYPADRLRDEFRRMQDAAGRILGSVPPGFGAPAWRLNADLLRIEEDFGVAWASDTRGPLPFLPRLEGRTYRIPQLPVSLPTLDEYLDCSSAEAWSEEVLRRCGRPEGYECLAVHAEVEGLSQRKLFRGLLRALPRPVAALGSVLPSQPPEHEVAPGLIPGRPYEVWKSLPQP